MSGIVGPLAGHKGLLLGQGTPSSPRRHPLRQGDPLACREGAPGRPWNYVSSQEAPLQVRWLRCSVERGGPLTCNSRQAKAQRPHVRPRGLPVSKGAHPGRPQGLAIRPIGRSLGQGGPLPAKGTSRPPSCRGGLSWPDGSALHHGV